MPPGLGMGLSLRDKPSVRPILRALPNPESKKSSCGPLSFLAKAPATR